MLNTAIYHERDWILQLSRGDETAFAQLFNKYSDKLFSFIVSISGSNEIAEDVVQDVFLKVWQMGQGLANIENFDSYLFRMAHNHALNVIKRRAKEILVLAEIAGRSEASKAETFFDLEYKEIQRFYKKAIEKLPPQQKLVITMSRENGLKQQEIARRLNISVATVKCHMTEALRSLRKESYNSDPIVIIYFLLALV